MRGILMLIHVLHTIVVSNYFKEGGEYLLLKLFYV